MDLKPKNEITVRKKNGKWIMWNDMQLYSLCVIPMLLVFVFSYLPMFGIVIAFKDYNYVDGILKSPWCGLSNFTFFFTTDAFWRITRNTLFLNLLFMFTGTIVAIAIALLLFEIKNRATIKTVQTIMITPTFLSWVVVSYMVYAILNTKSGYLNKMLGINVDWYSKPAAWPAILALVEIWKGYGMSSVIYYAALMGIDSSCIEAAEIDGATKWDVIKYVIIPTLTKLIIILTILRIGGIFRADFSLFYQVTRNVGTLYPTTDVIDTYVFRSLTQLGNISMGSAVGLLQSVVGLLLVLLTNFICKRIDPDTALF